MRARSALIVVLTASLLAGASALPVQQGAGTIASAHTSVLIDGRRVGAHVSFRVPPGTSVGSERRRQIDGLIVRSAQLGSDGFAVNSLRWPDATLTLHYNPDDEPDDAAGELLTVAMARWSAVPTSVFRFARGEDTDRCPSLVEECPGNQSFDGHNDVGWVPLGGERTLGIAWYAGDEIDIGLNSSLRWSTSCEDVPGHYDLRSVLMHETGHALGLTHSHTANAVMVSPYDGATCHLRNADREGVTYLYPAERATIRGTVVRDGKTVRDAVVRLVDTGRRARTRADGSFVLKRVPYPVTYEITVKKNSLVTIKRFKLRGPGQVVDLRLPGRAITRTCRDDPGSARCR